MISATVGKAFLASGGGRVGLSPAVAGQASRYFDDVLAAAPAISAELDTTDPVSVQATKIGELLAPLVAKEIPGAPADLAGIVQGTGTAIQVLLDLLGKAQPASAMRGEPAPEAVPFALTAADRRAIAKSVAKAREALRHEDVVR